MSRRVPRSGSLAVAVLGALAVALDAGAADTAALCGSGPLDILLTNDDGWQAPGLRALYSALRAAGHRVTVAAPDHNASGTSSSFTWGPVAVQTDPADPAVHGVAGSPATAAVFGITALYPSGRHPDLVISGINDGTNAGAQLAVSGTIGAALAGTMLVTPPVPGIAVNAERPEAGNGPAPEAEQRFQAIARHLAGLLATTRGWFCEADGRVHGTAVLNVNYPARPVANIAGVAAARQADVADMALTFVPDGNGRYRSDRVAIDATPAAGTDLALLRQGYVTVTPIGPGLTPGGSLDDLARRIGQR